MELRPARPRRRASGWFSSSLAAAILLGAACGKPGPRQPVSVILVSLDTLRADRLGAYGYGLRQTSPNLDRFAEEAVVFERHVAGSPWTTPSHMTLLTSLSPAAHGVISDFGQLGSALHGGTEVRSLPQARTTLAEVLADGGWHTAAFTGGVTMDPALGFAQGFARYETGLAKLNPRHLETVGSWLASTAPPFFLFLHTFEVHAPYLRTRFLTDVLEPERAQPLERRLQEAARTPGWKDVGSGARVMRELDAFTPEVAGALYDGGVWNADRWLGSLFAWMRERGLYDSTLIAVTSDHGEQLGERDGAFYDTHGHTLFEELVHVPLIVKLPGGRRAGERVKTVTRAIDVMPTLLAAAGARPRKNEMEGRDLLALPAGAGQTAPPAFSEALAQHFEAKAVRGDRYKLIVQFGADEVAASGRSVIPPSGATQALYDLLSDPREQLNLLRSPAAPGDVARARGMERVLRAHIESVRSEADSIVLGDGVREQLRTLGYIR